MIVKITNELMALVGATTAEEFPVKLSEKVKSMGDASAEIAVLTQTVTTLAKTVGDMQTVISKLPTETKITEMISGGVTASMNTWAASESGKQLIGAEASRITMAAIAAVGTVPVKSSPAPANNKTASEQIEGLQQAGKFEEAFALLPVTEQAQWLGGAKAYAAFFKASLRGQIGRITEKREQDNLN